MQDNFHFGTAGVTGGPGKVRYTHFHKTKTLSTCLHQQFRRNHGTVGSQLYLSDHGTFNQFERAVHIPFPESEQSLHKSSLQERIEGILAVFTESEDHIGIVDMVYQEGKFLEVELAVTVGEKYQLESGMFEPGNERSAIPPVCLMMGRPDVFGIFGGKTPQYRFRSIGTSVVDGNDLPRTGDIGQETPGSADEGLERGFLVVSGKKEGE